MVISPFITFGFIGSADAVRRMINTAASSAAFSPGSVGSALRLHDYFATACARYVWNCVDFSAAVIIMTKISRSGRAPADLNVGL